MVGVVDMRRLQKIMIALFLAVAGLVITGCNDANKVEAPVEPVGFHAGDECHVCGMLIAEFPGPKGQAVATTEVRKFCSAAEMIGWWLQPENQNRSYELYVHDMARSDWYRPDDAHLINARDAWYVAGTGLEGAMGAVLATFADEQEARALAQRTGGHVMRFDEIDQTFLSKAAINHQDDRLSPDGH